MEMNITHANEKNISELISLFTEICREMGASIGSKQKEIENMFVRAFANNNTFFLAKIDGENIGYLWISVCTNKLNNKKVCTMHDTSLKKDFREKGYDQEMVSFLKNYAKKEGCDYISAEIAVDNQDTIRFLEKLGFKNTHKVLHMKL